MTRLNGLPAAALALAAGCAAEPTLPSTVDETPAAGSDTLVASLVITPSRDTLTLVGTTARLAAVARNADGAVLPGKRVSWTSARADIATVDTTGMVRAVNHGTARITARSERVEGIGFVTVEIVPASLDVTPDTLSLFKVGEAALAATLYDSAGSPFSRTGVSWSSLDPTVVTVARTDVAAATASGRDIGASGIVATFDGIADTVAVVVALRRYRSLSSLCGVTTWGYTECWGQALFGQLGIGYLPFGPAALTPRRVSTPLEFTTVRSIWAFNCGLTDSGMAYCWGANMFGQLGVGTTTGPETCTGRNACSMVPIAMAGGNVFADLPGSWNPWTCGLTRSDRVVCWGLNGFGQLGNGSTQPSATPKIVSGAQTYVALSGGGMHACALTGAGAAYCWGGNDYGQLGIGGATGPEQCGSDPVPCSTTPVAVFGGLRFVSLTSGKRHSCGIATDGFTYCWGANELGQLGTGSATGPQQCAAFPCGTSPVRVSGDLMFTELSAGNSHACGLTSAGAVHCWGANSRTFSFGPNYGQLGVDTAGMELCLPTNHCSTTPVRAAGGFTFSALAAGDEHTCALTTDGIAICWGANGNGDLADGTQNSRHMPMPVVGSQ